MKGGDILELLFFVIVIAITVIGRIIKAQSEKAKSSRDDSWGSASSDDGWETWEPESATTANNDWSTPAPTTGKISKYQQEMQEFEQKKQVEQQIEQPPTPPPPRMPTPKPMANYEVDTESAYDLPEPLPYEEPVQQAMDKIRTRKQPEEPVKADEEALVRMHEAMANAFPKARRMTRKATGKSGAIHISIHGRNDLRRAVLLNEVLGQPRAFDL